MASAAGAVSAWVVLPGHMDTKAEVQVEAVTFRGRMTATLAKAALWGTIVVTTLVVTVGDPFMTSMPALMGAVAVWRSWRGRFRIRAIEARCPRCGEAIPLKPNARVSVPHPLVCLACHHEPQLVLRAA